MNRMYFDSEEVTAGLPYSFIEFLLKTGSTSTHKIDLHVYHEDCGAITVEWIQQYWNPSWPTEYFSLIDPNKDGGI